MLRLNVKLLASDMILAIQDWLTDPVDDNCITMCPTPRYRYSKHRSGKLSIKSRPVAMYRGLM